MEGDGEPHRGECDDALWSPAATADDQGNKKQHQQILDAVTGGSMGGVVKMNPNTGEFSVQAWREGDSDIVLVELAREL